MAGHLVGTRAEHSVASLAGHWAVRSAGPSAVKTVASLVGYSVDHLAVLLAAPTVALTVEMRAEP